MSYGYTPHPVDSVHNRIVRPHSNPKTFMTPEVYGPDMARLAGGIPGATVVPHVATRAEACPAVDISGTTAKIIVDPGFGFLDESESEHFGTFGQIDMSLITQEDQERALEYANKKIEANAPAPDCTLEGGPNVAYWSMRYLADACRARRAHENHYRAAAEGEKKVAEARQTIRSGNRPSVFTDIAKKYAAEAATAPAAPQKTPVLPSPPAYTPSRVKVKVELPNNFGEISTSYTDVVESGQFLVLVVDERDRGLSSFIPAAPPSDEDVDPPSYGILVYDGDCPATGYVCCSTPCRFTYKDLTFHLLGIGERHSYLENRTAPASGEDDFSGVPLEQAENDFEAGW